MLKIRLQRIGRRNNPSYRVVVVDSATAARKGKPVELLGTYDTIRKTTALNSERIQYWLSTGAQPSDTMHNILIKNGVLEGVAVNVLPRKSPITKKKDSDTESGEGKAADEVQASDTTATETENAAGNEKAETAEQDTSEKNSVKSSADTDEKTSQSAPPQKTPSAEG